MKNWKTTSAGIAMIAGALISLYFNRASITETNATAAFAAILGGVGLIFASDATKETP